MRPIILSIVTAAAGFAVARTAFPPASVVAVPNVAKSEPTQFAGEPPPAVAMRDPEKPTSESLRAALKEKDVFRASRTALAWVETATVDDFRAFVKDPKKFPRMYFAGFDDDFQKAFLDAFVERWLTLAPGYIALIEKNDSQFNELIHAAARAKPELVLAQLSAAGKSTPYDSVSNEAFESLGARDHRAARRVLETIRDPKKKRDFEFAIIRGLAKTDVFAAAALLPEPQPKDGKPDYAQSNTIPSIVEAAEDAGPGVLRQIFAAANGKFDGYSGLPRLLLRYPDLAEDIAARGGEIPASKGAGLNGNLLRDAGQTLPDERAKILAKYEKLPPTGRDALCAALACEWARTEPRAAADWALAHAKADDSESPKNSAAQYVFLRWVSSDSRAAFEWWESLPPSPMRDMIGMEASTRYAEDGDFETAQKMFRPVAGKMHEQATSHLASLLAKRDPVSAAAWLASLPPGIPPEDAVAGVTARYFNRDPEGAARWLEALPAGFMRDQAHKQFAIKTAQFDPAGAAEFLGKISDPKIRTNAVQWIIYPWQAEDPVAAREWVLNQPWIDENFRATFLNQ